jgi:16S rRNA processing protein RimM
MPNIRVGQIVAAFGIRGQVKVKALTDFVERFDVGRRLLLNEEWVTIKASAEHKGATILTLSGVSDRNRAEALQWAYLEAVEDERPELHDDEFLSNDLIGLTAIDEAGASLGVVKAVQRYPAHDVLVVGDVMVPAVSQFVRNVDLKSKTITLRPIPGMFDEDES